MAALARLLYPAPPASRSPMVTLAWWERRRLQFNLIVGGSGLVTLAIVNLLGALPPAAHHLGIPWLAPVVYGVLANLCYCGGWILETAFNAWWGEAPVRVGPVLFRQGLIFSVGLTLLPIAVAGAGWAFRLLDFLF